MKQYLSALILLLGGYLSATTVTGTISDVNGNRYANGTVSAFNLITGASMTPGATDANGSFSITLSPSTYLFTVCARPVNIGPSTSTSVTQVCSQPATPIVISGGSQDVSAQINAVAPILGPSVAALLVANNAFTGNNTHAGTEAFNGLVSLTNTLTGSGSAAVSGTFGGISSFTNTVNVCRFDTFRFINSTNICGWAGTEAGAWINAAAADCPSTGCTIFIAAETFPYSTPIVISKAGVKLKGMGKSATALNFTGTGIGLKNDAEADSFEDFSMDCTAGPASACVALLDDNGSAAVANGSWMNLKINGGTRGIDMVSTAQSIIWNQFINIEVRNSITNAVRMIATTPGFVNENTFSNCLLRTAANTGTYVLMDGTNGQVAINKFDNCDAANASGVGGTGYNLVKATENIWVGGDLEQNSNGIKLDVNSSGNHVFGTEDSGCTSPCFNDLTPVAAGNTSVFLTRAENRIRSLTFRSTNPTAGDMIRWLDAGNAEADENVQNGVLQIVNGANFWKWNMLDGHTEATGYDKRTEVAAPSGVASIDLLWADSTAHRFKMNNNNGGSLTVAATSGDTFTTTTLTSPTVNGTPAGTGIATLTLKKGTGAGNYSNASTTPIAVDGTNLTYTVTIPTGWKLGISASGSVTTSTAVATATVQLYDGVCNSGTALQSVQSIPTAASNPESWSLNDMVTGDGASHTINLCYSTSVGADTVTMLNSTAPLAPRMLFNLVPSN